MLLDTPDTIPEEAPTVAIAMLLLLHVPPVVGSDRVMVPPPPHTVVGPVMAAGRGFTVSVRVISQPVVVSRYVMVVVPSAKPDTRPVEDPIVATDMLLLLQVPLGVKLLSVTVEPRQTPEGPEMVKGSGLMVTMVVVIHEVGSV